MISMARSVMTKLLSKKRQGKHTRMATEGKDIVTPRMFIKFITERLNICLIHPFY